MARVLLTEDDDTIGRALEAGLRSGRHTVRWCRAGEEALAAAASGEGFDVAVLDLGLPDLDGVDVCRGLRTRLPDAVIVILTARDAEIDVVVGLEAGADDYLRKPTSTTELLARIRAHLRRASASTVRLHRAGALTVDENTRRAWLGDSELALRAKQFDLLARMTRDAGVALSRATLMADVWDDNWFGSTKTLDVHVAALRRVLDDASDDAGRPAPPIVTLRGFGYRLEAAAPDRLDQ